ncbi:MAG TPA: peptidylprolyl isomerase [Usitatibacteraceae bacterium]|nr:peptidylprolyl isomerase [Usitatibacteraceae bacterium]
MKSAFLSTSVRIIGAAGIILAQALGCASAQALFPPDKVLASNSRASVTYEDFEAELSRIPQRDHFEFLMDRQRLAQLIDNILLNKTLALEARELKVDRDPKVQAEIRNQVDKVLAKYRGQYLQRNTPKADYNLRAREIYLSDPGRFTRPAKYHLWHVLVSTNGRTAEDAQKRAAELHKQVLAGVDLARLAVDASDDPTAKTNKGDLEDTDLTGFDPKFAETVRPLRTGDVTAPFLTRFGWHVAKVLKYTAPVKESFDVLKADLVHEAETKHLLTAWDNHLKKTRNDPMLFVDVDALEKIRPKMPPLPTAAPAPADRKP